MLVGDATTSSGGKPKEPTQRQLEDAFFKIRKALESDVDRWMVRRATPKSATKSATPDSRLERKCYFNPH
eukprot:scaffold6429_cov77-Skeletonema_dohrnii-CCMP3373.AAC.14